MRQRGGCWVAPDHRVWRAGLCEFSYPLNVVGQPVLAEDKRGDGPRNIWPGHVANGIGGGQLLNWFHSYV